MFTEKRLEFQLFTTNYQNVTDIKCSQMIVLTLRTNGANKKQNSEKYQLFKCKQMCRSFKRVKSVVKDCGKISIIRNYLVADINFY